ncbi:MAG: MerR family transcriptional regulator [Bryobacterales bacterium]|nr:MerR family transcriptional regulator [Bryobacterales bacterium]MBV9400313.1 MerR family transcriptional regulator [Bryobacterales bacterium]
MHRFYKIREFAELAGVTIKALHHYDRLGLLKPGRTDAGYRVYCARDLETLEQIIALKFLGLPLKKIGEVLKRPALDLRDTLRLQRQALEDRREAVSRAIRAIRAAEEAIESGKPADLATLKNIIEVINMQDGIAVMKKYYSEESWELHRRYYEHGPSVEWQALYHDAQALLGEDPGSAKAQELAERWFELSRRAYYGDPEVQTDSPSAWMDRANWPDAMKQRLTEYKMEEVHNFVRQAVLASQKKYFSEAAWEKLMQLTRQTTDHSAQWQARVDLFRDTEAALDEDPAGERAQELVARWNAQLDTNSGGDPEIRAGLLAGWSRRKEWPASVRWQVEALHMMSFDRFERAADFLDRAAAASTGGNIEMTKSLKSALLDEFEEEMAATRTVLECVPEDKFAWKPHERSFTLGRLANHVAILPGLTEIILKKRGSRPPEAASKAELLEYFAKNVAACREALAGLTDEQLAGDIMVTPTAKKPLWWVLRGRGLMNHMIHHRGQLTVYLRLLDVPVPGVYGPSADEKEPAPPRRTGAAQ